MDYLFRPEKNYLNIFALKKTDDFNGDGSLMTIFKNFIRLPVNFPTK